MCAWKKYTGSDEQIYEIQNADHGFILQIVDVSEICSMEQTGILHYEDGMLEQLQEDNTIMSYLICKPHPLTDMICQQSKTGHPVWVTVRCFDKKSREVIEDTYMTYEPDWHIFGAEYRLMQFKEEINV